MRQTLSRRPSRRTRSCTPPCPASRSSDPLLPPHCCVWPAFPQRPEYAHRVCPDRAALDVQGAKLFVRCFRRSAVPVCAPSRTLISPAQPYPMHWHRCRGRVRASPGLFIMLSRIGTTKLDTLTKPSRNGLKRSLPSQSADLTLQAGSELQSVREANQPKQPKQQRKPRDRKQAGKSDPGEPDDDALVIPAAASAPTGSAGLPTAATTPHPAAGAADLEMAVAAMSDANAAGLIGGGDEDGLKTDNIEGRKGAWDVEEDAMLISLVQELGAKRWSLIAARMPGRIGKQVRADFRDGAVPSPRALVAFGLISLRPRDLTVHRLSPPRPLLSPLPPSCHDPLRSAASAGTTTSTPRSARRRGRRRRMRSFCARTASSATAGPRLPSSCPGELTIRSRCVGQFGFLSSPHLGGAARHGCTPWLGTKRRAARAWWTVRMGLLPCPPPGRPPALAPPPDPLPPRRRPPPPGPGLTSHNLLACRGRTIGTRR